MAYISYEKYGPEYKKLWDTMHIIRDAAELQRLSDKIFANKAPYEKVQKATGVPWQMVAVIHVREAGEQDIGRWRCCLHNGEAIIGKGTKTHLVPAGRGPFNTWHEAAVDALKMKGFQNIPTWPVARVLWALEPYNGYGYRNKGLRSPYLWASTNHQQRGKYVADGVFDPNVVDREIGCAALLKYLAFGKDTGILKSTISAVATGLAAVSMPTYAWTIAGGGGVGIAGYLAYKYYKGKQK